MSKQTIKAFLFMELDYTTDYSRREWRPTLWKCQVDDGEDRIFVKQVDVDVDVPDDFDPTGQQIAALEKEKQEMTRRFAERIADLNERISKLQAITYEAAE